MFCNSGQHWAKHSSRTWPIWRVICCQFRLPVVNTVVRAISVFPRSRYRVCWCCAHRTPMQRTCPMRAVSPYHLYYRLSLLPLKLTPEAQSTCFVFSHSWGISLLFSLSIILWRTSLIWGEQLQHHIRPPSTSPPPSLPFPHASPASGAYHMKVVAICGH